MRLIHSKPLERIGSGLPIFLSGFILIGGLAILLQQVGLQSIYITQLMLVILFGTYFYSGISAATMSLDAFQNARRCISPFYNGQGIAAGMLSIGIYIMLPGYFYNNGTGSLDYFSGWLLAVVLMTTIIAAPYNKTKTTTLPAFIISNRDARWMRLVVLFVVLVISILLLMANFILIGELGQAIFSLNTEIVILATSFTIGFCLLLGGIQSMTMARIFCYVILLVGLFVPLVWMSVVITGNPFPQLSFGSGAVSPLLQIGNELTANDILSDGQVKTITSDLGNKSVFSLWTTIISIACGLSVMPHLVQHFAVVETPSNARKSGIWAFAFLVLVMSALPALAAFAHFEIFSALAGLDVVELAQDAEWLFALSGSGKIPLIAICGELVGNYNDIVNACNGGEQHVLQSSDITLNPQFFLIGAAPIHNLPTIMFIILGLGVMTALWSTCDGLLLVMANTLSNDFYKNVFRPRSPMSVRLFMTRFWLCLVLALTTLAALIIELDIILLLETGIALSAAALFPAVIMKVWFKQISEKIMAVMVSIGFAICALMISPQFYTKAGEWIPYTTHEPFIAGFYGMVTVLFATLFIHLFSIMQFNQKDREHASVSN